VSYAITPYVVQCEARIAQLERELAEAKEEIGVLNRRRGGECDTCGKWVCPPIRCVGCMMKQRLTPHANPEPLAADVLAAATRRAEEAEGAVKVLREACNVIASMPGRDRDSVSPGVVYSLLERANTLATAALAATVRKEGT